MLLIDDDLDSRIIYATALRASGFEVDVAAGGADGLSMARQQFPDVILLDISMPELDGRVVLRRLRSDPLTHRIPTIALTAAVSLHQRGELEADGFDAVLLKPIAPGVVVTAVRQVVSSRGG